MAQQPRTCLQQLVIRPLFGISWIIFFVSSCVGGKLIIERNHPPLQPVTRAVLTQAAAKDARQQDSGKKPSKAKKRKRETAQKTAERSTPVPTPRVTDAQPWRPLTAGEIWFGAFMWGYVPWSLYWGMPACFRLMRRGFQYIMSAWASAIFGCIPAILLGAAVLQGGVFYSFFGGGIYQFFRRWWIACHPVAGPEEQQSSTPRPSSSSGDVEGRLSRLAELYSKGFISQEEYDSRRRAIIDDALR
jgi:Short C-terminal domain